MSKSIILKFVAAACVIALVACGVLVFGKTVHIGLSYADAAQYTAGGTTLNADIKNLDINWIDGSVNIAYHAQDTVEIAETAPKAIPEDGALRWWLDGDTLRIQYAKPGFFSLRSLEKALTVTLPEGIELGSVAIDATSADVNVPDLRSDDVQIDLTSGNLALRQSGKAARVALSSTSGDLQAALEDAKRVNVSATSGTIVLEQTGAADSIRLSGTSTDIRATLASAGDVSVSTTSGTIDVAGGDVRKVSVESTSGDIGVRLTAFDELRIDATSGNVTATLPSQPGYQADVDTTSGRFDYAVALSREGDRYVCGDGSARVRIDTTSGDVKLTEANEP